MITQELHGMGCENNQGRAAPMASADRNIAGFGQRQMSDEVRLKGRKRGVQ
jgi:hypothetical protein